MKYLLQVYLSKAWWEAQPTSARAAFTDACQVTTATLAARGHLLAMQRGDSNATTLVCGQDGAICVNDGPLPATHAYLIERYFINARDLNHAIAVATHMPQVQGGIIEVTPFLECSEPTSPNPRSP